MPMIVGLYTPNYPGITGEGGIGSYTRTQAHELTKLGHNVHVLTPGRAPSTSDKQVCVHFTRTDHLPGIDKLMPGAGACWRIDRSMRRLVRLHGIDVVEFANWEGFGTLFFRPPRPPIVVRLATSSQESQLIDGTIASRSHRWNVRRERWQAKLADILITHSNAHREEMAKELGIPPNRILLVPLGTEVSPDWVRPCRRSGVLNVVYLGRLEHRKGTIDLLQAIPKVLQATSDVQFTLIGEDRPHCPGGRTHAQYLKQEFPSSVRSRVTIAGRLVQADVDRWLQNADLFVAPSVYESFGLIFIEAMRWGTPVIGTRVGGIPEIVDEKSGVLVRPNASAELADAIIRLLNSPEQRHAIGESGRRRVEEKFSVQYMARQMESLYSDLIRSYRSGRKKLRSSIEACHAYN
jgi:glycogen(starch) synthase